MFFQEIHHYLLHCTDWKVRQFFTNKLLVIIEIWCQTSYGSNNLFSIINPLSEQMKVTFHLFDNYGSVVLSYKICQRLTLNGVKIPYQCECHGHTQCECIYLLTVRKWCVANWRSRCLQRRWTRWQPLFRYRLDGCDFFRVLEYRGLTIKFAIKLS